MTDCRYDIGLIQSHAFCAQAELQCRSSITCALLPDSTGMRILTTGAYSYVDEVQDNSMIDAYSECSGRTT